MAAALAGCAGSTDPSGINDPGEEGNRRVHAFNKSVDQAVLRPTSSAYGRIVPEPVIDGIDNFAGNLSMPAIIINKLLQFKLFDAVQNTARFTFNTTVGLGGLIDISNAFGIEEKPTDFGETLHVWGIAEGPYVELPFFGPSTGRDAVGTFVDFVLDPVTLVVPGNRKLWVTGAKVIDRVGDRHTYSGFVDSVLYDSEDSYAQARLLYLQNRRRTLTGGLSEFDLEDPYAE